MTEFSPPNSDNPDNSPLTPDELRDHERFLREVFDTFGIAPVNLGEQEKLAHAGAAKLAPTIAEAASQGGEEAIVAELDASLASEDHEVRAAAAELLVNGQLYEWRHEVEDAAIGTIETFRRNNDDAAEELARSRQAIDEDEQALHASIDSTTDDHEKPSALPAVDHHVTAFRAWVTAQNDAAFGLTALVDTTIEDERALQAHVDDGTLTPENITPTAKAQTARKLAEALRQSQEDGQSPDEVVRNLINNRPAARYSELRQGFVRKYSANLTTDLATMMTYSNHATEAVWVHAATSKSEGGDAYAQVALEQIMDIKKLSRESFDAFALGLAEFREHLEHGSPPTELAEPETDATPDQDA